MRHMITDKPEELFQSLTLFERILLATATACIVVGLPVTLSLLWSASHG